MSPFSSPRPFPTTPTKLFEEKLLKPLPQIIKKEEVKENKELDTIDRNLAAALKDESVVEYSLDHLIVSPACKSRVFPLLYNCFYKISFSICDKYHFP